jgi:hypothetical protein
MAAPTNAAFVKKTLANPEPSTHGPKRTRRASAAVSAFGGIAAPPKRQALTPTLALADWEVNQRRNGWEPRT